MLLSFRQEISCSLKTQCCFLLSREPAVRWECCVTTYSPGNQLFAGHAVWLPILQEISCSLKTQCCYLLFKLSAVHWERRAATCSPVISCMLGTLRIVTCSPSNQFFIREAVWLPATGNYMFTGKWLRSAAPCFTCNQLFKGNAMWLPYLQVICCSLISLLITLKPSLKNHLYIYT
jgi:hypothetical protein